ncbi:MAG TPA: hypothetical protein VHL79_08550 [Ramlibacter sp.]|jgi:hypothetical protein|nr:hypothetical protein [Ramlibacter sp.]
MSLFTWFSAKKKPDARASMMPSSGLSRLDSTKPFPNARAHGTAQPANRKQERLERRELLYSVVREAMVRAGVLSSSYKFKVLSLDARGRQFMVMVDLAQGAGSDTTRLAEIEAMVAQSAKARYDILVSAVYWRANEHVAIGDPAHFTAHKPMISQPGTHNEHVSRPAPLSEAPVSRPAPLRAQFAAAAPVHKYEPLQDDEVTAFRKALEAGVRGEQALAAANGGKPPANNHALLTGFEDTEMAGEDPHLSGTQYGALR